MPRVVVDREKCTALGLCESIAPDVFEIGDDGTLVVLEESHGEVRRGDLEEAVDACPTAALSIEED